MQWDCACRMVSGMVVPCHPKKLYSVSFDTQLKIVGLDLSVFWTDVGCAPFEKSQDRKGGHMVKGRDK